MAEKIGGFIGAFPFILLLCIFIFIRVRIKFFPQKSAKKETHEYLFDEYKDKKPRRHF